jgi:hypothetical protein
MPKAETDKSQAAPPAKPAGAAKAAGTTAAKKRPTAAAKPGAPPKEAARAAEAKKPAAVAPVETPAAKPASAAPPATAPSAAAAEENPLHKKLRLRPEDAGVIIAPPKDDDNPLLPLPANFLVFDQAAGLASHKGQFDYIHVFARDRTDLIESFALLRDKLAPGGSLWVSWLKQSSRGAGRFGDLNENLIRRLGLTHALVDVKVAGLDKDWSALRLVHRKH